MRRCCAAEVSKTAATKAPPPAPRSEHVCMVFERLGPSLYDFLRRNSYRAFPLAMVRGGAGCAGRGWAGASAEGRSAARAALPADACCPCRCPC